MPEHKDIVDSERHEPRGADTAVLDTVLKSNGDTTTSWVDPSTLVDVGNVKSTTLLQAFSTASSQQPPSQDVAMQVEFGNAVGTVSDPVMLANDGTITFNEAGSYQVRVILQYGRTGSQSQADLHARALVNGIQLGNSISASVDTAGILIASSITSTIPAVAGLQLTYELVRDSSGADAGGLFSSAPTLAGWNFSPSASILVERIEAA